MSDRKVGLFLTGGLGNQLFQYAAALSREPGTIIFDCELGLPRKNRNGKADIFDFKLPGSTGIYAGKLPRFIFSKAGGYMLRQGMRPTRVESNRFVRFGIELAGTILLSIWLGKFTHILQGKDNGYWKMPYFSKREYLIGYFQSYIWATDPKVYSQLQTLKLANMSTEFSDFVSQASGHGVVAVHVRLGDYKKEVGFGIPSPNYYESALHALDVEQPIKEIWLFSNEPTEALSYLPAKYHIRTRVIPDFNGNAAETLQAMRIASRYVIGNSSLSWWGAFLSYSESPIVIAPNPWFSLSPEPKELVPPHWIRLDAWPTRASV